MQDAHIEKIIRDALKLPRVHVDRQQYDVAPKRDFYASHPGVFYNRTNGTKYSFNQTEFTNAAIDSIAQTLSGPYSREAATKNLQERLPSWGFLYQPGIRDSKTALECRLLPLHYDNDFYLTWQRDAQGFYPLLDAYQMLTAGRIPYDSLALADSEHFQNLLGEDVAQRAYEHCLRPEPRVTITYDEPRNHGYSQ